MTDEQQKTWLTNVAAIARDVTTISLVIAAIGGFTMTVTRSYWKPFAELPVLVAQIQKEIATTQATITQNIKPVLIDFQGQGQIVGPTEIEPGGSVEVFYSLRRNASCDTDVRPFFYDVTRGLRVAGAVIPAVKAPVTADFIPFRISVATPPNIPPGTYVYYPEVVPKNCGVYGPLQVPPTTQFVVR